MSLWSPPMCTNASVSFAFCDLDIFDKYCWCTLFFRMSLTLGLSGVSSWLDYAFWASNPKSETVFFSACHFTGSMKLWHLMLTLVSLTKVVSAGFLHVKLLLPISNWCLFKCFLLILFFKTGFHYVAHDSLKLTTVLPQSPKYEITGVNYFTQEGIF
jgi:hypothetical protein